MEAWVAVAVVVIYLTLKWAGSHLSEQGHEEHDEN